MTCELSVVIPLYNEADGVDYLLEQLKDAREFGLFPNYEIIVVNDGSIDNSLQKLIETKKKLEFGELRIISYAQNQGLSYALKIGIEYAKYAYILYLDSDLQVPVKEVSRLLPYLTTDHYGLICGIRKKRHDGIVKKIISWIANSVRSFVLKDNCEDTGCPLKLMRRDLAVKLPLEFRGFHRFIPYFFMELGVNIKYLEVEHNKRIYGKSKFNVFNRFFGPIADLFLIKRLMKKRVKNVGVEVVE